jgi:DhnA family fructose-bisphosphate aldolase class Ia
VLVRGGGRVSDEEILARTRAVLDAGRARDRLRAQRRSSTRPGAMVRALRAVVHGDEP